MATRAETGDRRRRTTHTQPITLNIERELLARLDSFVVEAGGARSGWIGMFITACLDDPDLCAQIKSRHPQIHPDWRQGRLPERPVTAEPRSRSAD